MKIKNWIENSIIAIIVAIVTVFAVNKLKFEPMQKQFEKQVEKQNQLIEELSKIEKYKIENTFDKVKAKEGTIDLNLNNSISVEDSVYIQPEESTKKKKGLFNLFKKK